MALFQWFLRKTFQEIDSKSIINFGEWKGEKKLIALAQVRLQTSPSYCHCNKLEGLYVMYSVSLGSRAKRDGGKRATVSTFAATDYTLEWIKRYCQFGSNSAAVAGIDMTYKLGPFYLTTETLPNPMFVYKSNKNKHPTTLAAVMTSVSKRKA